VYWQALDGGGWGLVDGDNGAKTLGAANVKYFVLAQYARHVRPGDRIIDGGDSGATVAALRGGGGGGGGGGGTLVLVRLNTGRAQAVQFDLSRVVQAALGKGGGGPGGLGPAASWKVAAGAAVPRWVTEPKKAAASGGDRYKRYDDTAVGPGSTVSVHMDADSVMTLEVPLA
jgi:galactan endo-1,6-beta-galactosidase